MTVGKTSILLGHTLYMNTLVPLHPEKVRKMGSTNAAAIPFT